MVRRISEATQGGGPAKEALEELGLSAHRLAMLAPDKQLEEIADAMQSVASQGDRVRLAMKLFDTEGVALVNTLASGSQGLRAMRAEADQLGLSFSRVDAAKVEAANDSLSRVRALLEGMRRQMVVELAPIIEAVATKFKEIGVEASAITLVARSTLLPEKQVYEPKDWSVFGLEP